MRDKIRNNRNVFIYGSAFLLVLILYHVSVKAYFGDDYQYFSKVLSDYGLIEWLKIRYTEWSSRVIIEAMLVWFSQHIFLWKLTNILVGLLLAYSLYKLSHGISLFTVVALIVSYPLTDMASAGWIATFMNYWWPLAFGLYSLVVLDKLTRGEAIRWWEVVCSFIAALIGTNVEQYCVVHLAMLALFTIRLIQSRSLHKIWLLIGHYVISISSLIFILTAPGNSARKSSETITWMKDFYEKTIIDRFVDGVEKTMSTLLTSSDIIFLIFVFFLFACVWRKTKNNIYRIIGAFPLGLQLTVSFGKTDSNGFIRELVQLVISNTGVTARNWIKLSSYLPLFLYGFLISGIIMAFFVLLDDFYKAFECSFIFCIAIISGVIMGFSPTLFASVERTYIFCYFLLILLVLKLLEYSENVFSDKEKSAGRNIMAIVSLMIALNNIVQAGNII